MNETVERSGHLHREDGHTLAWRRVTGRGPTVVWLGGFHSDMTGTKAQALADWGSETGHDVLRFDYFGHGQSSGRFAEGTIRRWREDVLAILDGLTQERVVLVGSSMGGWLAVLAALARPERVRGLVLVAPAADFTEALIKPSLSDAARVAIAEHGAWRRPSDYADGAYEITRTLLDDGAQWTVLPGPVAVTVPVRVLQGGQDPDVPWRHALALAEALQSEDLVFSLIRDGDHRLSRPQDLARLLSAVSELAS